MKTPPRSNVYSSSEDDIGTVSKACSDGGQIIGGYVRTTPEKGFLLRIQPSGDIEWALLLGTAS